MLALYPSEMANYKDVPLVVKDWDRDCGLFQDGKSPGCMPLWAFEICHAPTNPLGPYRAETFER
jgi:hypothetical protein